MYLEVPHNPNANLVNAIIGCESGWNPTIKNASSSALGLGQFLIGTWKHYAPKLWGDDWVSHSRSDAKDSYDLVTYVVDAFGTHDWDASSSCWK